MADHGNVGSHHNHDSTQTQQYVPLTSVNDITMQEFTQPLKTPPVGQGYYTDTAGTQSDKYIGEIDKLIKHLDAMPAPATMLDETNDLEGPNGLKNLFLLANPLVAFFMVFTEMANTLRQMALVQAHLTIMQMDIVMDLAKCEAHQIIEAANAESKMYIASAVASFAEAGAFAAQGIATLHADRMASKQLDKEGAEKNTDFKNKTQARTEAQEAYTNSGAATPKAEKNLAEVKARQPPAKEKEVQDAEAELTDAKREDGKNEKISAAKKKLDEKEEDYRISKADKEKFDAHYAERKQAAIQHTIIYAQAFSQSSAKFLDGAMNIWKSQLVLQKAEAEALQKMLGAYEQLALKMLDNLNNARQEDSKVISELMSQLRNFSDTARKLGGSIAVQTGV